MLNFAKNPYKLLIKFVSKWILWLKQVHFVCNKKKTLFIFAIFKFILINALMPNTFFQTFTLKFVY